MSLSTTAAARQKEMKVSMAVVATMTLATGREAPCASVTVESIAIGPPGGEDYANSRNYSEQKTEETSIVPFRHGSTPASHWAPPLAPSRPRRSARAPVQIARR